MDEKARRSARTRAAIAFGLAGVLVVVNVVAAMAWRDDRRDRFEDRIGFEQRMADGHDRDDMMRPGGGGFPGSGQPPGGGQGEGGAGQDGRMPMGPGGRSDSEDRGEGRGSGDQDSNDQDSGDQDSGDQDKEGTA